MAHEAITNDLDAAHRELRVCEMRLEAAHAHTHFAHLAVARQFDEGYSRASRRATRRRIRPRGLPVPDAMAMQDED
jgi:hypothetical protein